MTFNSTKILIVLESKSHLNYKLRPVFKGEFSCQNVQLKIREIRLLNQHGMSISIIQHVGGPFRNPGLDVLCQVTIEDFCRQALDQL